MALEVELLLYFLGAPAAALAIAVGWCRRAMRSVALQQACFLRRPAVVGRFFVFTAIFATALVFGVVLLILALEFSGDAASAPAVRSVAVTFAVASSLAVVSEAWIIVRRVSVAFGDQASFGRVLILAVMPHAALVWSLIVSLLVFGKLPRSLDPRPAAFAMIAGAFSPPLMAGLANREEALDAAGFSRALRGAVAGEVPLVVALVVALLAIGIAKSGDRSPPARSETD